MTVEPTNLLINSFSICLTILLQSVHWLSGIKVGREKRRNRVWASCWSEAGFGELKSEEQTELMDVWMTPIELRFSTMSSPRVRSSRSWQSWYWVAEFERSLIKPNISQHSD
jgi:hypothetical protein